MRPKVELFENVGKKGGDYLRSLKGGGTSQRVYLTAKIIRGGEWQKGERP